MLTDLFAEINAAGYRVNNLFQGTDMTWQCNLHRKVPRADLGDFTCFARAKEPEDAVRDVMKMMVRDDAPAATADDVL